jgi:hypothetical protein
MIFSWTYNGLAGDAHTDSRLPNSQILASQCLIRNFDLSSGREWRFVLQVLAVAIPFLLQVINNGRST